MINRKKRVSLQKAILIISLILLFILILIWIGLVFFSKENQAESEEEGNLGTFGILTTDSETGVYFPEGCSGAELKQVWDSIFRESSNSVGIISNDDCEQYFLYKFSEYKNITYILSGINKPNEKGISAIYTNISQELKQQILDIDGSNLDSGDHTIPLLILSILLGNGVSGDREIINSNAAEMEFTDRFSLEAGNWEGPVDEAFIFTDKGRGIVHQTKILTFFFQNTSIGAGIPICTDSDGGQNKDVQGTTTDRTLSNSDYCITDNRLREYYCENETSVKSITPYCDSGKICENGRCVQEEGNNAPIFLSSDCGNISWTKDKNYTLDMEDCFEDSDNDDLEYKIIRNSSCENYNKIGVIKSGTKITLMPLKNWVGNGCFYITANDSKNNIKGTVNFQVYKMPVVFEKFEIKNPLPKSENVTVLGRQNKTFSIDNTNYNSIAWYVDNFLVQNTSKVYRAKHFPPGNYTIHVEIKKGAVEKDNYSWNLRVLEDGSGDRVGIDAKKIIFWAILIIFIIIILLVVWLFIDRKKDKPEKMNLKISSGFKKKKDTPIEKNNPLEEIKKKPKNLKTGKIKKIETKKLGQKNEKKEKLKIEDKTEEKGDIKDHKSQTYFNIPS